MKDIIKNNFKSYLIISIIGILAGLIVWFFSQFPYNDLWSFSLFSSMSLGFWVFTSSVIVFFSTERKSAVISEMLYVYFMFFFTGVEKITRLVQSGSGILNFNNVFFDIIFYVIPYAIICGILAYVLFYAKKRNILGNILLLLPFIYILIELIDFSIKLFINKTNLFMVIIDFMCLITYIILFRKDFKIKKY